MASDASTLRLGTRSSLLAKAQSQLVASDLEKHHKGLAIEIVMIKTSGDEITSTPLHELGGKGLFTRELDQALLRGEIDLAVHSFKDVPVTQPLVEENELIVASVPLREDPMDVFVSRKAKSLADLPTGAKIGTCSLRRRCQVLAMRTDLDIQPLRGNIDTRLRKLHDEQFDAILLASAGLRRTGLFDESEMSIMPLEQMLPAPGQGALALVCRGNDPRTRDLLSALDHAESKACVTAERILVAALGGDCHSPIAALARIEGDELILDAAVGARGGNLPVIRASAAAPLDRADVAVAAVLKSLLEHGAQGMLGTI